MKSTVLGLAAAALVVGGAAAQPPAPPAPAAKAMPAALKPNRIRGTGITVADLEKEKAFYVDVLGMTLLRQINASEIALGFKTGPTDQASLVLLKGTPKPGSTSYGRMILDVPDADALAQHLTSLGYPARKVGQPSDRAYFVADPEGNFVELYTPPPGR